VETEKTGDEKLLVMPDGVAGRSVLEVRKDLDGR